MQPNAKRIGLLSLALTLLSGASGLLLSAEPPQAVGTWAPASPVSDSRSGAVAVALPDGRTLIAGGVTADGQVTDSVVYFDPATQAFSPGGVLQARRTGHGATLLKDGRVFISGGNFSYNNIVSVLISRL